MRCDVRLPVLQTVHSYMYVQNDIVAENATFSRYFQGNVLRLSWMRQGEREEKVSGTITTSHLSMNHATISERFRRMGSEKDR